MTDSTYDSCEWSAILNVLAIFVSITGSVINTVIFLTAVGRRTSLPVTDISSDDDSIDICHPANP